MKITIEATPEEIAKLLQAIGSSKEQEQLIDASKLAHRVSVDVNALERTSRNKA